MDDAVVGAAVPGGVDPPRTEACSFEPREDERTSSTLEPGPLGEHRVGLDLVLDGTTGVGLDPRERLSATTA